MRPFSWALGSHVYLVNSDEGIARIKALMRSCHHGTVGFVRRAPFKNHQLDPPAQARGNPKQSIKELDTSQLGH